MTLLKALVTITPLLFALPAFAAEKIAFVGALSGPDAGLGRDQRDGFLLAVSQTNGRLGGVAVKVVQYDERRAAIADQLLASRVRIVTGLTEADSAMALHESLRGKPVVLVSSGAAPGALAGSRCSAYFFSTAAVEDAVHENAGAIAQARRYKSVQLVTLPGSRSAVETAFRRRFTGTVRATDYAAANASHGEEIEQIRKDHPDSVYVALPSEEMRSFMRAYSAIGLFNRIPVIMPHGGPGLLDMLGADFPGLIVSARWAPDMESRASKKFVAAFKRRYGRVPSVYAMQGYDAALLIAGALRATQGKPVSASALARALAKQRIEAPGGPLRLAANGFPVTDWYDWEVFNESSGSPYLTLRGQTLSGYTDPHAAHCVAR